MLVLINSEKYYARQHGLKCYCLIIRAQLNFNKVSLMQQMTKLIIIHATCKDKIIRNLKATHEVVSILSVNGDNHKKQLQVGFF